MKILLAHKLFHITGGAEVFFFEVGRVLEFQGHDVAYFSTKAPENQDSIYSEYFVSAPDYKNGSVATRSFKISKIVYSLEAKHSFQKLVDKFKPDIVHVFSIQTHISPSILDVCRAKNVPVVMSCNDYKHICPNYKLYHHGRLCEECKGGKFYNAIKNRCCKDSLVFSVASSVESYVHAALNIYRKNIHTFLFASQFMAHKTEEFWGKETFRWSVLRNPFDAKKHLLNGVLGNYFLYFGRLIDEKGVDVIVQAASLAPEVELMIVGDGPDRQLLEERASAMHLTNVKFVGPKWGDELNDILRNCLCVIVPSLWHENFPYVILQAFAAGKPVIGSNRGGIPELIQGESHGLVYEAQEPEALVASMRRIVSDPELALKMGDRAKEYVEREFNDDAFYKQLMCVYKEALA
jgi:glycosyltransferase involved in cell wall biosynthesis